MHTAPTAPTAPTACPLARDACARARPTTRDGAALRYRLEGIQWNTIPYSDNRDCLDLLQDKTKGLFALLDDVCRGPKPTDDIYLQRVYSTHLGHAKRLQQPRPGKSSGFSLTARESFVVEHFAGRVCYAVSGFVDKNIDALTVDCELALVHSHHPLISSLFTAKVDEGASKPAGASKIEPSERLLGGGGGSGRLGGGGGGGGGGGARGRGKPATVSSAYMAQMATLQSDLVACAPHFIRCIKTNHASVHSSFDGSYVLMQLRCSGMMEALKLMQAGYPTRCPYKELASRYRPLMPPSVCSLPDATFVEAILNALEMGPTLYKLGITRVFFRAGQLAFLEKITGQVHALEATRPCPCVPPPPPPPLPPMPPPMLLVLRSWGIGLRPCPPFTSPSHPRAPG